MEEHKSDYTRVHDAYDSEDLLSQKLPWSSPIYHTIWVAIPTQKSFGWILPMREGRTMRYTRINHALLAFGILTARQAHLQDRRNIDTG